MEFLLLLLWLCEVHSKTLTRLREESRWVSLVLEAHDTTPDLFPREVTT